MHGNVPCVISQKIVIGERKKKKNVKNNKENDVHLIQKWIPNLNVGTVPMWDFVEKIVIGERKKKKKCQEQQRNWCSPDPKMNSKFQIPVLLKNFRKIAKITRKIVHGSDNEF